MNIGKSVVIKGELSGSEDLTIEGQVEGQDRAAAERAHHRAERQDQGPGVRQGRDRARRSHRQRHRLREGRHPRQRLRRRRSGRRLAWPSPKARTSAAASTCSAGGDKPGSPSRGRPATRRPKTSRPPQPQRGAAACRTAGQGVSRLGRARTRDPSGLARLTPDACSVRRATLRASPRPQCREHEDFECARPCHKSGRPLADRLFPMGTVAASDAARPHGRPDDDGHRRRQTLGTKAFGKFLVGTVESRAPVLLDLGPVVGDNINFLGERLGCKFVVEDCLPNLETHREKKTHQRAGRRSSRRASRSADASFDGILCWDILDYLDKQVGADRRARDDAPAQAGRRAAGVLRDRHACRRRSTRATWSSTTRTLRHRAVSRVARPPAGVRQPRHQPDVRRADGVRIVPADDEDARDRLPQAGKAGVDASAEHSSPGRRPDAAGSSDRGCLAPVLALLTDFGLRDHYVGSMKAAALSVCPD